jgi:hypothetical protein
MLRMRNAVCWLLLGLMASACFFDLSTLARAAPRGSAFRGGAFRGGAFRGGAVRNPGPAFRTGFGVRREFAFRQNRRFGHRDRRFFVSQFGWPVYWYPYYYSDYYPWDTSYLDYGSDYDYGDNALAPVQPEYPTPTVVPNPVVVVINQGNSPSRGTSSAVQSNGYYGSSALEDRQRTDVQKANEQKGMPGDPVTSVSPAATQAAQAAVIPAQPAVQATPAVSHANAGDISKLVLVSWLHDGGKDVIFVQNTETRELQKVTSEANKNNLRIVEVHPSEDLKDFEAIISNGSEQGPVKFRF